MKLKCEENTPKIEAEILAQVAQDKSISPIHRISTAFEHGQWYIGCLDCGEAWSVNDAQDSNGNDYFSFESLGPWNESCQLKTQ